MYTGGGRTLGSNVKIFSFREITWTFYSLLLYWCERPIVLAPGDDDMGSLLSRQHGAASWAWAYGWGRARAGADFFLYFCCLFYRKKTISVFITTARCRVARGCARASATSRRGRTRIKFLKTVLISPTVKFCAPMS
jgi:hypothetical protein